MNCERRSRQFFLKFPPPRIFGAARIDLSIGPRRRTYTGSSADSSFSGAACHRRIGNIFRLSLSLHNTLVSSTARRHVGFPLKRARFPAQLTSFSRRRDTYSRSKIGKMWLLDLAHRPAQIFNGKPACCAPFIAPSSLAHFAYGDVRRQHS